MARKWEKKILWKHVVRTISQVIDIIRIKYISRLNIANSESGNTVVFLRDSGCFML